jgi:hypothetical protein
VGVTRRQMLGAGLLFFVPASLTKTASAAEPAVRANAITDCVINGPLTVITPPGESVLIAHNVINMSGHNGTGLSVKASEHLL